MDQASSAAFRASQDGFRWEGVAHLPYKQDGSAPFKDISRQVLFAEDSAGANTPQAPGLGCELRYFEMAAGGYSTLERHEHVHAVMILRGRGECLVGQDVRTVKPLDLVTIPSWTWHQFRATQAEPLGFLCMANVSRDRPRLPDEADIAALMSVPAVARFLRQG